MLRGAPRFAYAQARMQARHGERLSAAAWEGLERGHDFGRALQSVRSTRLAPSVEQLDSHSTVHDVEHALRKWFRDRVGEVADWQPARWHAAFVWVDALPDLPALQHLLQGRTPPAWLAQDDRLAAAAAADSLPARREEIASSVYAPLAAAWAEGEELPKAWYRVWHQRWPPVRGAWRDAHLELAELFTATRGSLLPPADESVAAKSLWPRLDDALRRLFRRHAQTPIAGFAHLGLLWLDTQRLRGDLASRRVLPGAV